MSRLLLTLIVLGPSLSSGGGADRELDRQRRLEESRLCSTAMKRMEPSPYGGISLKLMLWLDGGARAVFKPEQTGYSARYEAEIAAYRLAMHLGVDRVPAACERRVRHADLLALAADPGRAALRARLERELRPDADGWVRGAAIAWVPKVAELPVSQTASWARSLAPGAPVAARERSRLADLVDLLLLDLLFGNPDRFTGGNLLEDTRSGRLLMIDNGADFRPVASLTRPYHAVGLGLLGRIRRPTYLRMRRLDRPTIVGLVRKPAGQGSYLGWHETRAMLARRDALVRHVEALRKTHGDEAVFLP